MTGIICAHTHTFKGEYLAAAECAMREKGTIEHNLAHGVFAGHAGSGKSSLMSRLVGEMPSSDLPSTGVACDCIQVVLKKSSSVAACAFGSSSNWLKLVYDEEAIRLLNIASESRSSVNRQQRSSTSDAMLPSMGTSNTGTGILPSSATSDDHTSTSLPAHNKHVTNDASLPRMHDSPSKKAIPRGYVAPMPVLRDAALKNKDKFEKLCKHFKDSWSLNLTDSGGQIEFQELLPLLISGPSIYFITFRLDFNLKKQFVIEYRHPGGDKLVYKSTLTLMDSILETLASIASMPKYTYTYQDLQVREIPLKPKVFIVGTHKDKLNQDNLDSEIREIDQSLQQAILSTSHYTEELVEFAKEGQLIYTVNNVSRKLSDDFDFQLIRSGVEKIVSESQFSVRFPTHWLFFSLVLRQKTIEDGIISYDECYTVAQDCGISDRNELNNALKFLHAKIGLIKYFPLPILQDIVIRQPQILFDMVTTLIVETFTFENVRQLRSNEFKKKGIFSKEDFIRLYSKGKHSNSLLSPENFLHLLEELRIVALFEQEGKEKCFIPCVLAHCEESRSKTLCNTCDVPPLLIKFDSGYCPKGLPASLIVCLLTKTEKNRKSELKWKLMTNEIFRDQVTFRVNSYDILCLKIHAKYLEIAFSCTNPVKCIYNEVHESICYSVRIEIQEDIDEILNDMKLTTKQFVSFYCKNKECNVKEPHPATEGIESSDVLCDIVWCKNSGNELDTTLQGHYCYWFETDNTVSRNKVAHRDNMQPSPLVYRSESQFEIIGMLIATIPVL